MDDKVGDLRAYEGVVGSVLQVSEGRGMANVPHRQERLLLSASYPSHDHKKCKWREDDNHVHVDAVAGTNLFSDAEKEVSETCAGYEGWEECAGRVIESEPISVFLKLITKERQKTCSSLLEQQLSSFILYVFVLVCVRGLEREGEVDSERGKRERME